jgi:FAD/FMN-containing dehydrogenase
VPISRIPAFVESTDAALLRAYPGARLVNFGHLGDGNLHYNVSPAPGVDHVDARSGDGAHRGDAPILHRHVGFASGYSGAVDHGPAPDYQVVGAFPSGHDISSVAVAAAPES